MIIRPTLKQTMKLALRRMRQGGFIVNSHFDQALLGPRGPGLTLPTADGGLYGWYSSDTGLNLTGLGNVSSWNDRSGLGHTATTSGDPNSPHIAAADINGKTSILVDSLVNLRYITFGLPAKPLAIVWLMKQDAYNAGYYMHDGSNTDCLVLYQTGGTGHIQMYSGGVGPNNSGFTVSTWYILTELWNGASSTLQANNTTAATGNPGTSAHGAGMTVGYNAYSVNAQWRFAGCIITASLDATNLGIHKTWLADYGGLTI